MPTRGVCWVANALTPREALPKGTTELGDAAGSPTCDTGTDVPGTDVPGTDALDGFRVGAHETVIVARHRRATKRGGPPDRHALGLLREVMICHSIHAGHGQIVGVRDDCLRGRESSVHGERSAGDTAGLRFAEPGDECCRFGRIQEPFH